MSQCTATSKRTHERCRDHAMQGRETCYHHGGVTTTLGPANRHYTNGRYSKLLPTRLQQRYEDARTSPRLLSLADDLAVCEARLADLFQRVDTGESGQRWQAMREALDAFSTALAARDAAAMNRHLTIMRQLATQGNDDAVAWGEILKVWDARCKLTLTEQKTLSTMQQMITAQQLMTYLGVVTDVITRTVTAHADADTARGILGTLSAEFNRLTLLEARPGVGS